ncbi:putative ripening related protein [Hordeum vulgare]|nr:putative ripening related protein [Hordeum vulgare]
MRRFPAPAVKAAGKFELRQNVPAMMTVNDFQQGKGDGGEALCDDEFVVSLSPEWYAGRARCGRTIRIADSSNLHIDAKVVDKCAGCEHRVG